MLLEEKTFRFNSTCELNRSGWEIAVAEITVRSHRDIRHRGLLFKTTGGHLFKPLHSEAKCMKWTQLLQTVCCTQSDLHCYNVIRWTFGKREDLILSASIAAWKVQNVNASTRWIYCHAVRLQRGHHCHASLWGARKIFALSSVQLLDERQNEPSIIHSGHIRQVIVRCWITSAAETRVIHLSIQQKCPFNLD